MKGLKISLLLVSIASLSAQAQGVTFREDLNWEQLKQTAKTEKKQIFLDVMATWCGPCKAMEASVYPDTALGAFFANNFISVKVQTDQTKNDSEFVRSWYEASKQIMTQYQVTGLPSLLFLSPDGKLLSKVVGARTAEELTSDAKKAMDPANQYEVLMEDYFKGQADKATILQLIQKTDSMGRKIMAQHMAYEKLGQVTAGTAYAVLADLTRQKPGKPAAGFSGSWHIDYPACEFGDKPLRAAAKQMEVTRTPAGMRITRLSSVLNGPDITSRETVTLAGQPDTTLTSIENRKKISRVFVSPEGTSFTEFSEVTLPDDPSIDYAGTEAWQLLPDGRLSVVKTVYMNNGAYTLKLVFKKK